MGDGARCAYVDLDYEQDFIIGLVLGFKCLSGTGQMEQYTRSCPPVQLPDGVSPRGIGCLCDWYNVSGADLTLKPLQRSQNYLNIRQYLCSVPIPEPIGANLSLPRQAIDGIFEAIKSV